MESEFIVMATVGKEAKWLRNILFDIKLPMSAIFLYCDSEAIMSRAYSNIYNGKLRHISIQHGYIRELITNGVITIVYVRLVFSVFYYLNEDERRLSMKFKVRV
jgi:hypothetical protein